MARGIRLGSVRAATLANGGIADGIIGFWPGAQASGDTVLTDRSGRDAHSSALYSSTTPWATAGYFTSQNTSGNFAKIPFASWPQRFATDSLLVFGQGIVTKEGANQAFIGNGVNTTITGFVIRVGSTGTLQWGSYGTGASEFEAETTETPWGTAVLASFAGAWDTTLGTVKMWVNGVRCANFTGAGSTVALSPATIDAGLTGTFGIGGSANGVEVAANWKNIHAYYRAGAALPTAIDAVVLRLHNSPSIPLTAAEWDSLA